MRRKVLGSTFGLPMSPPRASLIPDFLQGSPLCFVNARSALRSVAQGMAPGQAWLPSFLCPSIPEALSGAVAMIRYYDVGAALAAGDTTWLAGIRPGDLVVVIDYFGFPFDRRLAAAARERGAVVIEDASQALLSAGLGAAADFLLFSPRKTVGVPDGAVLRVLGETRFTSPALAPPPAPWWLDALRAVRLRTEFDRHGGERDWFPVAQSAEGRQPIGAFRMSDLTRALLEFAFDYRDIADRRIANYRRLVDELGELALFPELPEKVVPLGFPIRVADRDGLRSALFAEEIFPAVHWPIAGVVPAEFAASHRLAAEILTLPCDQRCDGDDLRRMAAAVRAVLRR